MSFSISSSNHRHLRISYSELLKATYGFSSSNLIGVGSYGDVYKRVLKDDTKNADVKVFNLQRRGALKSFIAECNALRYIRHKNLNKILTACSRADFKENDSESLNCKKQIPKVIMPDAQNLS
ncbi:hypothetical protein GIB67_004565 [Kingdonia uniflora]|uniref:Serine-threonine/tyrosine-protein kinase catalytic domain-containing protein n=1 Tax=Kingdonia uniflora TaxID=39325 RepID=A0A7J7ML09_9MAGN|nr:hypothetical protein GIB67_004565 [Kingdonia uniflora]